MTVDTTHALSKEEVCARFGMSESCLQTICTLTGHSDLSNPYSYYRAAVDFHLLLYSAMEHVGFSVPDPVDLESINWKALHTNELAEVIALGFYSKYHPIVQEQGVEPLGCPQTSHDYRTALLAHEAETLGRFIGLTQIRQPYASIHEWFSEGTLQTDMPEIRPDRS